MTMHAFITAITLKIFFGYIIMKISVIATVALLSLLALASSASNRYYYQEILAQLQKDVKQADKHAMAEQKDGPGKYLPCTNTTMHKKVTCTINSHNYLEFSLPLYI